MATNSVELVRPITKGVVLSFKKTAPVKRRSQLLERFLTCWHWKLTRPITHGSETYQACLRCGMHRTFDVENWTSTGSFYMPTPERRAAK
jgi:hypothetical protein